MVPNHQAVYHQKMSKDMSCKFPLLFTISSMFHHYMGNGFEWIFIIIWTLIWIYGILYPQKYVIISHGYFMFPYNISCGIAWIPWKASDQVIRGWESLNSTDVFSVGMLMGRKKTRSVGNEGFLQWEKAKPMKWYVDHGTHLSENWDSEESFQNSRDPVHSNQFEYPDILPSLQKRPLAPSKCWTKNLKTSFNIFQHSAPRKSTLPRTLLTLTYLAVDPLSHGHAVPVSLKMCIYI
jgi:hypothetical protein